MNVNDLICVGAEPIAMLDFILCREADPEVCGAIGVGLRRGAELAGVEIPGGEIAQVGDIVTRDRAQRQRVGLVGLDAIVDGARASSPGTPSSACPPPGLHSNGYTLARRVLLDRLDLDDDRLGRPLGRGPARAHRDLRAGRARAARLAGRRPRPRPHHRRRPQQPDCASPRPSATRSPTRSPLPPVFELIAELGDVSDDEMYEVFNMGCGFAAWSPARTRKPRWSSCARHYPAAKRIGTVTDRAGVVERR